MVRRGSVPGSMKMREAKQKGKTEVDGELGDVERQFWWSKGGTTQKKQ